VRGDFYISVIGLDGKLLAYGADSHHVGDNVMPHSGIGCGVFKLGLTPRSRRSLFSLVFNFLLQPQSPKQQGVGRRR
jgi:hypothetical protein